MVFRRENKVDAFQRQMNSLRQHIGAEAELDAESVDLPEEEYTDQYEPEEPYNGRQDGYSFGSYPADDQPEPEVDNDQPPVPELPQTDTSMTVIAANTTWKGDLTTEGTIEIFGNVNGTITSKEDVWLAEGSIVDATISARRVMVSGKVSGTVRASSRFEALGKGTVEADVFAPSFVVHEGATINGKLSMSGNDQAVTSGRAERAGSSTIVSRRNRS